MTKRKTDWTPNMGQRSTLEGEQVLCLTSDEGHVWIHYYDQLPRAVRQRLASSVFNICPACLDIEVRVRARRPSVDAYFAVIADIERKLIGGKASSNLPYPSGCGRIWRPRSTGNRS
jgi:hypothetical protein